MDKISFELDDYNIEDATVAIINAMIDNEPEITMEQGAKELGISVRTLFRWCKKYNIKFPSKKILTEENAVNLLKIKGYTVAKKEDPLSKFNKILTTALTPNGKTTKKTSATTKA